MTLDNAITVYYGLSDTSEDSYKSYWQLLDTHEQQRAQHIKNDLIRKRYVAIHGYLRQVLAHVLQTCPQTLSIDKTQHGKPYLADYPRLAFNLSHSDGIFAMALGWDCQLGIDIEIHRQRPNLTGLVNKCFATEEQAYWLRLTEEQKTAEFYRFWTRKEAFVKATGGGIRLGLQHCVINPDQPHQFLRIPNGYGNAVQWHLKDITLSQLDSHSVYTAVSTNKIITAVNLYKVSL